MKDKFKEYGCEFENEEECEEDLEEDKLSLNKEDAKHFDEEYALYKETYEEADEKNFKDLTEAGLSERDAAHIVNKEALRHIKNAQNDKVVDEGL